MKTQKPWRSELILRNFQHNFRSSEVSSWCLVAFILYCSSRRVGASKEARMKTQKPWRSELILRNFHITFVLLKCPHGAWLLSYLNVLEELERQRRQG